MNTAWKVIVSFWVPFLVIFPASLIEIKTNVRTTVQTFGSTTSWDPVHLYELLWFWYLCGIVTGVFLLYVWRTSHALELPDETQH